MAIHCVLPARTLGASAASGLLLPFVLGLAARAARAGLRDLPLRAGLRLLEALRFAAGMALRLPLAAGLRDLEPLEVLPELLQTWQGQLADAHGAVKLKSRSQTRGAFSTKGSECSRDAVSC